MNKYEFITNLQRHLTGKVSAEKLQELTAYYNDYIDAQIRKGRTEEEVLLELGDPRLLAKSIVETEGGSRGGGGRGGDGLRANTVYEEGGPEEGDRQSGSFRVRRIAFRIALLLVLFLILYIVFGVIGLALNIFLRFVLPVLVPLLIIYFIISLFRR